MFGKNPSYLTDETIKENSLFFHGTEIRKNLFPNAKFFFINGHQINSLEQITSFIKENIGLDKRVKLKFKDYIITKDFPNIDLFQKEVVCLNFIKKLDVKNKVADNVSNTKTHFLINAISFDLAELKNMQLTNNDSSEDVEEISLDEIQNFETFSKIETNQNEINPNKIKEGIKNILYKSSDDITAIEDTIRETYREKDVIEEEAIKIKFNDLNDFFETIFPVDKINETDKTLEELNTSPNLLESGKYITLVKNTVLDNDLLKEHLEDIKTILFKNAKNIFVVNSETFMVDSKLFEVFDLNSNKELDTASTCKIVLRTKEELLSLLTTNRAFFNKEIIYLHNIIRTHNETQKEDFFIINGYGFNLSEKESLLKLSISDTSSISAVDKMKCRIEKIKNGEIPFSNIDFKNIYSPIPKNYNPFIGKTIPRFFKKEFGGINKVAGNSLSKNELYKFNEAIAELEEFKNIKQIYFVNLPFFCVDANNYMPNNNSGYIVRKNQECLKLKTKTVLLKYENEKPSGIFDTEEFFNKDVLYLYSMKITELNNSNSVSVNCLAINYNELYEITKDLREFNKYKEDRITNVFKERYKELEQQIKEEKNELSKAIEKIEKDNPETSYGTLKSLISRKIKYYFLDKNKKHNNNSINKKGMNLIENKMDFEDIESYINPEPKEDYISKFLEDGGISPKNENSPEKDVENEKTSIEKDKSYFKLPENTKEINKKVLNYKPEESNKVIDKNNFDNKQNPYFDRFDNLDNKFIVDCSNLDNKESIEKCGKYLQKTLI
jgi:hypothetical protein